MHCTCFFGDLEIWRSFKEIPAYGEFLSFHNFPIINELSKLFGLNLGSLNEGG
jgi:hypothetical protein